MKHTLGPWIIVTKTMQDAQELVQSWIINADRKGHIHRIAEKWRADEEDLANARLIAAAPALLETLKAINRIASPGNRSIDDLCRDMGLACDIARAAIAEAEGGAA